MNSRRTTHAIALVLIVVMVLPLLVRAQTAARAENAVAAETSAEVLSLTVGRSTVIRTERPITRVSLSTPDIADAMVTTPYEVLVHGKLPGTISLMIWSDNGKIKTYDVAVRRDLSALNEQMRSVFPAESIKVAGNGKDVVLSGSVSNKYVIDRAAMLAVGYVDKPENVVNLLQQQTGAVTNQIMLRVRFAEVSRSAVQELGAGLFTGAAGKGDWIGRSSTGQFAAPDFDADKGLVFSDFLNLFAFNTEEQIGAVVKALKTKGLFQSLAEPNLITSDGKEASFLAGGEYPYPVIQASAGNSAVTIVFKEFGVRLRFTPTVMANDMIHLKVAPEVSTLDFGNGLILSGFRVPALATRRTDTEVELRDGQTFAIAGLLDNKVDDTMRKIPGIGDIPILGYLFKSQAYQKHSTELVVMITPHIMRAGSPGVTPNLPGLDQPFLAPPARRLAPPPPAFTNPSASVPSTPAPQVQVAPAAPASQPAVAQAPVAAKPVVAAQAPVASAVQVPTPSKADLKQQQIQLAQAQETARKNAGLQAKKDGAQARAAARVETARAAEQRVADVARARKEREQAVVEAKLAAQRQLKEQEELKAARKIGEKRAEEQAVIDRKRMIEQADAAARIKDISDQLAKEQERQKQVEDKAAQEQAVRDAEQSRLVDQYRKLTTNVQ